MEEAKYSYELSSEDHDKVFEGCKQTIGQYLGFECVEFVQAFEPSIDQFEDFEEDLEKVWGDDRSPDSRIIAHQLYIGKRVAAQAFLENLILHPPSELKQEQYAIEKANILCSKNDVEEKFREIFSDNGIEERAFMTSSLFDYRAEQINLERIALRILFDSGFMQQNEDTKIHYDELIEAAGEYIKKEYFSLWHAHQSDFMMELGRQPEMIDRHFFDSLPEWLIATATPMRPQAYSHLFSDAWKKD